MQAQGRRCVAATFAMTSQQHRSFSNMHTHTCVIISPWQGTQVLPSPLGSCPAMHSHLVAPVCPLVDVPEGHEAHGCVGDGAYELAGHSWHEGSSPHVPSVRHDSVDAPTSPYPGAHVTLASAGYRPDVADTCAWSMLGAVHSTPRHVGAGADHVLSVLHDSCACPTSSYPGTHENSAVAGYRAGVELRRRCPFCGSPSGLHSTPTHDGAVPPNPPELAMQLRCASPVSLSSYPAWHVYVAVDGYWRLFVYETLPWFGVSSRVHSRPTHVGAGDDHVPSAWHCADVAPISTYPVLHEKAAQSVQSKVWRVCACVRVCKRR